MGVPDKGLSPEEHERKEALLIENFWELRRRAEVYYAYSYIHAYIQEPFTTLLPENVFNVALYLWNVLASSSTASNRSTQKILSQATDDEEQDPAPQAQQSQQK